MIIAGQCQHATMLCGARSDRVLEYITGTVDTRTLAVPDREHAIVFRTGEEIGLLRAPDRGRSQIFIHAGMKLHVVRRKEFFRLGRCLVD